MSTTDDDQQDTTILESSNSGGSAAISRSTNSDEVVEPAGEPEAPQEAAQEAQEAPEGDEGGDDQATAREARKYRISLRRVETERDELMQRVETLQRGEAERIAALTVTNPAGIWAADVKVTDLLDDAGNIDEGKVEEATINAAKALGLARHPRMSVPSEGNNPQHPGTRGDMETIIAGR